MLNINMFNLKNYSIRKIFSFAHGTHGRIDPHGCNIVELMLNGTKPICELEFPIKREDINILLKAVEEGRLEYKKTEERENYPEYKTLTYFFCQPNKTAEMEEAIKLIANTSPEEKRNSDEYHRKLGALFGYDERDIEFFISKQNSTIHNLKARILLATLVFKHYAGLAPKPDYTPLNEP